MLRCHMHDEIRVNDLLSSSPAHKTVQKQKETTTTEKTLPNGDAISFSFRIKYLSTLVRIASSRTADANGHWYCFRSCVKSMEDRSWCFFPFRIRNRGIFSDVRINLCFKGNGIFLVPAEQLRRQSFSCLHIQHSHNVASKHWVLLDVIVCTDRPINSHLLHGNWASVASWSHHFKTRILFVACRWIRGNYTWIEDINAL